MHACRHKRTLTEVENNLTLLCERNATAFSGMGWPRAWGAHRLLAAVMMLATICGVKPDTEVGERRSPYSSEEEVRTAGK